MKAAVIISKSICFLAILAAYIMAGEPAPGSTLTLTQQLVGFFVSVIVAVVAAGAVELFKALGEYRRHEPVGSRAYHGRRCRRGDAA